MIATVAAYVALAVVGFIFIPFYLVYQLFRIAGAVLRPRRALGVLLMAGFTSFTAACGVKGPPSLGPELLQQSDAPFYQIYKRTDGTWAVRADSFDTAARVARDWCRAHDQICTQEPVIFVIVRPLKED